MSFDLKILLGGWSWVCLRDKSREVWRGIERFCWGLRECEFVEKQYGINMLFGFHVGMHGL